MAQRALVLRLMFMLESAVGTLQTYVANNEGLLLVVAAEAFFALMNASVKLLGTDVSVLEVGTCYQLCSSVDKLCSW